MKNILAGFLCVGLCISIAILLPQTGTSNPFVDDTGCLECHTVEEIHVHIDLGVACDVCHETADGGGAVSSSSCVECHPVGGPGACELVILHEDAGADCFTCHPDCEEPEPTECQIDVLVDSLPKSNWFALPLFFRIETIGIDPLTILTPVTIACEADGGGPLGLDSVFQTGKVIIPNLGTNTTVILQTVIVWPSWITQSGGREVETCTVTVGECAATDTFDLNYLPFFLSN
jgi:hypothetical protein